MGRPGALSKGMMITVRGPGMTLVIGEDTPVAAKSPAIYQTTVVVLLGVNLMKDLECTIEWICL